MVTQEFAGEVRESDLETLNGRLEGICWGLFFIVSGAVWLSPWGRAHEGIGTIATGLIMLGLNGARRYYGIAMSKSTIVLGSVALLVGLGELLGVDVPGLAILLILIGLDQIVRLWLREKGR